MESFPLRFLSALRIDTAIFDHLSSLAHPLQISPQNEMDHLISRQISEWDDKLQMDKSICMRSCT